ncbi:MAG: O-antigen ligase family protein [Chitinophagales bacterium]|nr:O-antigen ligase family protein [Bacteroidota bacterium]MCB9044384.1 O-antigen ligase family protein [Chitinophagales bacterium]
MSVSPKISLSQKIAQWRSHHFWVWAYIFFTIVMIVGLFYSRALISIATGALISIAVLHRGFREGFRLFFRQPAAVSLWGIFFAWALSGIVSSDTTTWLEWVRIKLPFIALPFAYSAMPNLRKKQYYSVLYFFFWLSVLAVLLVVGKYLYNFSSVNEIYKQGQVMSTPIMYVRFSIIIAFAAMTGIYLWKERFFLRFAWEKTATLIGVLLLIIFLHVLATRSGLLALYSAALGWLVQHIITHKNRRQALLLAFTLLLLPIVTYFVFPSFQNKVQYSLWDWEMYRKNDPTFKTSDYCRLVSVEVGLKLIKQNPILGVGAGDLHTEVMKTYDQYYPQMQEKERFLPINEWIFVWAATGLVGFVLFAWAIFFPLFYKKNYRYSLLLAFYLILLSNFIGENTIEHQIGYSFYLVFLLWMLRRPALKQTEN